MVRSSPQLAALLWDVDGTLAETERDGHRVAYNRAFEACGLPWRWDDGYYGPLLRVSGGIERLMHDMASRADAPASVEERAALARAIHAKKNTYYAELVRDGAIPLRHGVLALIRECRERDLPMGITTTTSLANVDALLTEHLGERWRAWFAVVVCSEDVQRKKPDPEVYVRAVATLGVSPHEVLAIEDSTDGAAAAIAAGVPVIVARSAYFADAHIDAALAVGPGLHERRGWQPTLSIPSDLGVTVGLEDLEAWWRLTQSTVQPRLQASGEGKDSERGRGG
jgi:HAD superfamily hydrolase (TIGR01509 family)